MQDVDLAVRKLWRLLKTLFNIPYPYLTLCTLCAHLKCTSNEHMTSQDQQKHPQAILWALHTSSSRTRPHTWLRSQHMYVSSSCNAMQCNGPCAMRHAGAAGAGGDVASMRQQLALMQAQLLQERKAWQQVRRESASSWQWHMGACMKEPG